MKKIRLKERREALGMTQRQVADAVGIAESAYQRYEYGAQDPNVYMAIKIAKALASDVEDLFVLNGE